MRTLCVRHSYSRSCTTVVLLQALPQSCCVLNMNSVIPRPENLAQCRHDVTQEVRSSAFLHTQVRLLQSTSTRLMSSASHQEDAFMFQGCNERLLSWFLSYLGAISGFLVASIVLQVPTAFQSSRCLNFLLFHF